MSILSGHPTTRKQGDAGLGIAIGWFVSQGYTVCIPLTDNQPYDLVVEIDNVLCKIQVKTTKHKAPSGRYKLLLKSTRANKTQNIVVKFEPGEVDYVFAVDGDDNKYLIPSAMIHVCSAKTLGADMDKYKLL